jgi:multidrug resistance protein
VNHPAPQDARPIRPWPALWALILGFFMILVDTTIVSVANPSILIELETTMTATLWATSAYLLAYAVPLLVTGRLGDRFGPRRIYLIGLSVFTFSSLACGLANSIEMLIAARAFQGIGAALMTPQTMAVITRIFAPRERGAAMAVWGVTAGVAMLVGPILGGVLLDAFGWEWIFFINVPVGVVGFALALRYVPKLPTSRHRFDWLGVTLSALGMFLLVFGIQEGESFAWGVIWGPISVWGLIISGAVILVLFVLWQRAQSRPRHPSHEGQQGREPNAPASRGEPLVPLQIFRDRNFSLGSAAIVMVGISMTSMSLPLMFYLQLVHGLTPTQSALILAPMAVISIGLARLVGRLIDRDEPRRVPLIGLSSVAAGLLLFYFLSPPSVPVWWLLVPSSVLGVGHAFTWGPLASITTFSLQPQLAGAGSGVYNSSRQIGAVFGTAAMAVLMQSRLTAHFGGAAAGALGEGSQLGALPEHMREGFAAAMAQSILMPLAATIVGCVIVWCFGPRPSRTSATLNP